MENKWKNIDCDFGELSGVGVCFCIGRNSIMGFVLGSLKKHRRDSSMGYFSIVTTSLCFVTHADSSITHLIGIAQHAPMYEICLSVPRSLF